MRVAILGASPALVELGWRCCRNNIEISGLYFQPHELALKAALQLGCSAYPSEKELLDRSDVCFTDLDKVNLIPEFPTAQVGPDSQIWVTPASEPMLKELLITLGVEYQLL